MVVRSDSRRRLVDEETFRRLLRSREWLGQAYREPVTLREAASAACLSPYYYQRLFTKVFGESPRQFVTNRRLERARELLARHHADVTEVCFAAGYSSLGSFSTLFRQQVGLSPSESGAGCENCFRLRSCRRSCLYRDVFLAGTVCGRSKASRR